MFSSPSRSKIIDQNARAFVPTIIICGAPTNTTEIRSGFRRPAFATSTRLHGTSESIRGCGVIFAFGIIRSGRLSPALEIRITVVDISDTKRYRKGTWSSAIFVGTHTQPTMYVDLFYRALLIFRSTIRPWLYIVPPFIQ